MTCTDDIIDRDTVEIPDMAAPVPDLDHTARLALLSRHHHDPIELAPATLEAARESLDTRRDNDDLDLRTLLKLLTELETPTNHASLPSTGPSSVATWILGLKLAPPPRAALTGQRTRAYYGSDQWWPPPRPPHQVALHRTGQWVLSSR
jgi:hypothetical protein